MKWLDKKDYDFNQRFKHESEPYMSYSFGMLDIGEKNKSIVERMQPIEDYFNKQALKSQIMLIREKNLQKYYDKFRQYPVSADECFKRLSKQEKIDDIRKIRL